MNGRDPDTARAKGGRANGARAGDPRYRPFPRAAPPELSGGRSGARVLIVGAGPIGLALAIDLAQAGIAVAVLDEDDRVSVGSRAICWAKRSLEILDRLGVGGRMVERGVTWKVGRLFHGEEEVFAFDLLPEAGYRMPAFVNLQQYHVERFLVDRCADFPDLIDLRWRSRVTGLEPDADGVSARVECPEGTYAIRGEWLVACDGARSPCRRMMGLEFEGASFEDRFLIADVAMDADMPAERWFWFEPEFHDGRTALLHKQPDGIYRLDLQLGRDADPEREVREEVVRPRIARALGGRDFEIDWVSIYAFHCRRLDRFVHGRVVFCGDSAHIVSPFGARGGNGGIHDVDNLGWKLAAVLRGEADDALIATYDEERRLGADENIAHSTRATRFMMAGAPEERGFRDAILALARTQAFARRLINSGRLSTPCSLEAASAVTPGTNGTLRAGEVCPDAPLPDGGWLLHRLGGRFSLLAVGTEAPDRVAGLDVLRLAETDEIGARYGRGLFLVRPDQHVAAVLDGAGEAEVRDALRRAMARGRTGAAARAAA